MIKMDDTDKKAGVNWISGGERSLRSCGAFAKSQALLIAAESKILCLESEVSSLRQHLNEEKIRNGSSCSRVQAEDTHQVLQERCHKLEQERSDLSEEVARMKMKWSEVVEERSQYECRQQDLQKVHSKQVEALQQQLQELQEESSSLEEVNDQLQVELHQLRLMEPAEQREELQEMNKTYTRSLAGLQLRLSNLEQVRTQLLESEEEVEKLRRQLRLRRQDEQFVKQMKSQLESVQDLQQQVRDLHQDNRCLQQDRTNSDLLRYQVHDLQKKCASLQGIVEEAAQLRLENNRLKAGGGGSMGAASEAQQLQLAELQQREIIAVRECGSLSTQLAQSQRDLSQSQEEMERVQGLLDKQKTATSTLEDRVQRLDRRLIFVTKERDGCVNVLSSYKTDTGVDGVLREWLAELKHQLEEKDKRIMELEVLQVIFTGMVTAKAIMSVPTTSG